MAVRALSPLERREAVFWYATYHAWTRGEVFNARLRKPKAKNHEPVVLAKRPNHARVFLGALASRYGVRNFRPAMMNFLADFHRVQRHRGYAVELPQTVSRALAQLPSVRTWDRVKFYTPDTQTGAAPDVLNIAVASPGHSRFDTVLVRTEGEDVAGQGGLEGIRAGRLRAIFKVPEAYERALFGRDPPGHLGYVEWYSKIPAEPNDVNGMFPLHRSRTAKTEASIVQVLDIRRACHLFPAYGTSHVDRRLSPLTILDAYNTLYLNNRSDKDAYRSIYWEDDDE